jgi:dipeptidyl aminopeptidase/acylaminoacyl peptidase
MTVDSGKHRPTIRDMFQMPMVGGGRISPDGDRVIYRLAYVDNFDDNQLEVYAYLYDSRTGSTHQFTRSRRVTEVQWVDNQTLALLKPTDNTSFQIHVFEGLVGEGQQITDHPGGIETFEPFGNGFIYIARRTTEKQAAREKKYGTFVNVEEEESLSALYYIDRERILDHGNRSQHSSSEPAKPIVELSKLLERPFKIESAVPSPSDDAVFINCRSREDEFYENDTYCFRIELDPDSIFDDEKATAPIGRLTPIALPKGARVNAVSPDGAKLLISYKESGLKGRVQADLWLLDLTLAGKLSEEQEVRKHLRCITGKFDQEPLSVYWTRLGIFLSHWNESTCGIARLSETGEVEAWDIQGLCVEYFHVNDDGAIFLRALSPTALAEIYYGSPNSGGWALRRITDFNERYSDWDFGTAESIRWTSRDGAEIEGILRKPSDFDTNKRYPLLFNVHGGPAAVSPFILLENNNRYFYPTVQLLNKGILILEPNYRGSLGRGQSFQALNFDNLGIGDMWDLESAIDHLAAQGFVDETRVGSMGWSQGGYISSFVAMHSTRFKAASAGAALCSWRTYYSGSDQRQSILLSGDPYSNKEMFDKTAPMSAINEAETPILFQHGEKDPRVPLISAMEMYRALKARGVETRLIVFPGQGHGLLKPRESYALMVQNYRWFVHHLLGEELDLLMDDTGETIGN